MMKIAIDARMLISRPTGIGRYIKNLVSALTKIDPTTHYVVLVNDLDRARTMFSADNVRICSITAKPFSPWEHIIIPKVLREEGVSLLHSPSFNVPLRVPCKHVVTIHDLIHIKYPGEFGRKVRFYYRLVVKTSLKNAARIITDSDCSKRDIVQWLRLKESKVRAIPLATEAMYRPLANEDVRENLHCRFNIEGKYLLYNGNKKPHKNISSLIKAFGSLKAAGQIDCRLVIVGMKNAANSETDFTALELEMHRQMVRDEVCFTGHVSDEDLVMLYSGAEAFIFPSLYEGFGLPPLEAMSCGCPVIVSNVSSLPEVCGEAAQYIDPNDPASIAAGIRAVTSDAALQARLRQKGLERSQLFSWEKCARETLRVYKEALNENSHCS